MSRRLDYMVTFDAPSEKIYQDFTSRQCPGYVRLFSRGRPAALNEERSEEDDTQPANGIENADDHELAARTCPPRLQRNIFQNQL